MTAVFEDNFERAPAAPPQPSATVHHALTFEQENALGREGGATADAAVATAADAARVSDAAVATNPVVPVAPPVPSPPPAPPVPVSELGPHWQATSPTAWHIENGKLCGKGARNHGVWLKQTLPVNAVIEFDAESDSPEGDIKCEVWGDGASSAKGMSYNDATSYIVILGGWKNTIHAIARENEHGTDRKQLDVDPQSDDLRMHPVAPGQIYHFKVERRDGHTVRWFVNGLEYLVYNDAHPLAGAGHDHFGFNDWDVKVCFDNVKVTPL